MKIATIGGGTADCIAATHRTKKFPQFELFELYQIYDSEVSTINPLL